MPDKPVNAVDDEPGYRIGAVCRMTGLSQHVLRVWEKRYGVVEPVRSENRRRLYRESDIQRLSLLKTLVDRGQAIGSIADLDSAELERRVERSVTLAQPATGGQKPTLALLGESLAAIREDCSASPIFTLLGLFDDVAKLDERAHSERVDVAVVEWSGLHPDSAQEVTRLANRLNTRHLILVYDFAARAALQRVGSERVSALRAPLDITALEAVVAWRFGLTPPVAEADDIGGPLPSRLFNDRELAHLASQSPAIACECPMHLAQLISKLVHFEAYSAECESRNDDDAALHAYLHGMSSRARSMMERALQRVVELENLSSLPDS